MMGVLAGWDEAEADPICDAVMFSLAALGRGLGQARRSARLLEERIEEDTEGGQPGACVHVRLRPDFCRHARDSRRG